MTHEQLQHFKAALRDAEAAAVRMLVEERQNVIIEASPDEMEMVTAQAAREAAIESIVRCTARLRHIRAALARIDEGEYGVCAQCGEEIRQKRLAVLPWTSLCLSCQEEADRDSAGDTYRKVPGRAA